VLDKSFAAAGLELDELRDSSHSDEAEKPPCGAIRIFVAHTEEPQVLARLVTPLLPAGLRTNTSGAPFVDITCSDVSKKQALAWLCRLIEIDASDVIAFGDELNDVEMLTWAGLGVAVANACHRLKEAADDVTTANYGTGVACYLANLMLVIGKPGSTPLYRYNER